jgi:hypothetical protein
MNSRLRTVLQNANSAALVSFLVGTLVGQGSELRGNDDRWLGGGDDVLAF